MRKLISLAGLFLFMFALWAAIFDGALKEVRTANPKYEHPDRHFAEIIEIYNARPSAEGRDSYDYWNNHLVEMCSFHMPSWEKTLRCVKVRRHCQANGSMYYQGTILEHYDVFSEEYTECVAERRPPLGLMEYLRAGRALFRIAVAFPILYAGEAIGMGNDSFLFGELLRWMEDGQ